MSERRRFPQRITVELTNACNLGCSFCPRMHALMQPSFLDEKLYCKIVDEAAQHLPVCLAVFFRGESLLHKKLVPFIRYAKEKGLGPLQLASNGLLLEGDLADELLDCGLDFISFSMDTNNKELYEKYRCGSDFDRAHSNVLSFIKRCAKRRDDGLPVPETQVSSVDLDIYRPCQDEFISFWRQYADIVRIYEEHSEDGNFGSIRGGTDGKRLPCKKTDTDMVICYNGTVALCNHDWNPNSGIGNVNESSIEALWNSGRYNEIIRMHETGEIDPQLTCAGCDHWKTYYTEGGFFGKKITGKVL